MKIVYVNVEAQSYPNDAGALLCLWATCVFSDCKVKIGCMKPALML